MYAIWCKRRVFAIALIICLFPTISATSEQQTLSVDEFNAQFQAYLETNEVTPELIAAMEECLVQNPEDNQIRYTLTHMYYTSGQLDKARICAKEALQYEPDSQHFTHEYMTYCSETGFTDEAMETAEYLLTITTPLLPPIGTKISGSENSDINFYTYLMYCMDANIFLVTVYASRADEEKMLQCGDWILQRKDDSDLGYKFGLYTMTSYSLYYGSVNRFSDMEYWLEQYFELEASANSKGDDYKKVQADLQEFTNILQAIYNAYLEEGDAIDIEAIIAAN